MKEGWEYKKLGEVCDIYQPKTLSKKDFVDDGEYFVYGANGVIGKHDHYNHECSEVLLGCRGSVGTVTISKPFSWINGNAMVIRPRTSNLLQTFLAYQLRNIDLSRVITGIAQPQITRQSLSPTSISIPSLAEQQHIVEELDLLSSIKEKKNNQLNELDNLAQSLFYEMFGDPITNEKGWEVSKLGEICIFLQGEQVPIKEQSEIQHEGMVRFLRIIDFTQGNEPPRFVFCKDKKHILDNDEIAIVRYGSPGFVCYGKYGVIANNLFKIAPKVKDRFAFRYLIAWLSSEAFQSVVNGNQYGAALQAIKFGTIKDIPFIQPPLDLQQQFASNIEAIEHQKELIKQSITEVETLFNSRMDYYFN